VLTPQDSPHTNFVLQETEAEERFLFPRDSKEIEKMNQMVPSEAPKDHDADRADIKKMAERELGAFFSAVKKSFGVRQAQLAADDWLQELEASSALPIAIREWRLITIQAARRLATRLNVSFQHD
jgi:hypothetical protein